MQLNDLKTLYKLPLPELLNRANNVREKYFGTKISYSRNYIIPISNYCRNNCGYCAFRPRDHLIPAKIYSPAEIQDALKVASNLKCWEVLFLSGEQGSVFEEVKSFLLQAGWSNLEEYYLWAMQQVVARGLLPHSNFGIIARSWLEKFKPWNASMGLMLESISVALCEPMMPHEFSPGKNPSRRLEFIRWAGELQIPFTTGLLIGVGESELSRLESLLVIKDIALQYGHIQEVILQNFVPNSSTPFGNHSPPSREEVLRLVAVARILFQGSLSIQVPPNLNPTGILDFIHAGANDLGGISPISIDYVNPREKWPDIEALSRCLSSQGYVLVPRLPVYDAFISDKFLSPAILSNIALIRKKVWNEFSNS